MSLIAFIDWIDLHLIFTISQFALSNSAYLFRIIHPSELLFYFWDWTV